MFTTEQQNAHILNIRALAYDIIIPQITLLTIAASLSSETNIARTFKVVDQVAADAVYART